MDGGADLSSGADATQTRYRPPNVVQPSAADQVRAALRTLSVRPISPAESVVPEGAGSPRSASAGQPFHSQTQTGLPPRPPKPPHALQVHAETRGEAVGSPSVSRPRSADPWARQRFPQSPPRSPDTRLAAARPFSEGHPSDEGFPSPTGRQGPLREGPNMATSQGSLHPARTGSHLEQQLAALVAAHPERLRLESQTSTGMQPSNRLPVEVPHNTATVLHPTSSSPMAPALGPSTAATVGPPSMGAPLMAHGPGHHPPTHVIGSPSGAQGGPQLSRHPSVRLHSGTASRRASVRHDGGMSRQTSMRDGVTGQPHGSGAGRGSGAHGITVSRQASHLDTLIVSRKTSREDRVAHVSAAGDLHMHVPSTAEAAATAPAVPTAARKSTGPAVDVIIENDQFDDVMDFWEQEAPTQQQHKPWYRREEVWQRLVPAATTGLLFLAAFVTLPQSRFKLLGFGVWKWLLWVAWLTPLSWLSTAGVHLVMLLVESTYLATRMVVYFMMGTKAALAGMVWSALVLGLFTSIFTIERGPEGSQSYVVYTIIVKVLCCMLLFHTAILLRILLARMMAAHFHKSAYFSKMHDALRKEYFLMALSQPRRPAGSEELELQEDNPAVCPQDGAPPAQEPLVGPGRSRWRALQGAMRFVQNCVRSKSTMGAQGRWASKEGLQGVDLQHEHEATPLMEDHTSQFTINMERPNSMTLTATPVFAGARGTSPGNSSRAGSAFSHNVAWGDRGSVRKGPSGEAGPSEGALLTEAGISQGSIEFATHSPLSSAQCSAVACFQAAAASSGASAGPSRSFLPGPGPTGTPGNVRAFPSPGLPPLPPFTRSPSTLRGGDVPVCSTVRGGTGSGSLLHSGPGTPAIISITAQAGTTSSTPSVRDGSGTLTPPWAAFGSSQSIAIDKPQPVLMRSRSATMSEMTGRLAAQDSAIILPNAPSILPLSRPCASVTTCFSPALSVHPIRTHPQSGLTRTTSMWAQALSTRGTFLEALHSLKERTSKGLRRRRNGPHSHPHHQHAEAMGPSASTHKLYREVFHIHNRNRRNNSAHGTPRKSRHNSGVGADGHLLAALHRLEKHIRKTKLKMTFAEQLGALRNAANEATTKEAEKAAAEVNSVAEARKMAFYLFWNIKEEFERNHILPTDLEHFLPPDQIKEAFSMLDIDADGKVTLYNIRDAVIAIYRERKNLAATLRDTKTVVGKVESIIGAILHLIFFFIYLAIFNVEMSRVWLSVSSTLLAFAFVFGNSIRTIYESVIFLFVIHPFDVGDAIVVHDDWYRVEEISLMYTVLCRWDNAILWYPNAKLYSEPMINLSKSKNKWEKLLLLVDLVAPIPTLLERLNKALPVFVKQWPSEFTGNHTVVLRDIKDPLKGQIGIFYEFAHPGDDLGRCSMYRSKLYAVVLEVFKEMGVRFSLPPMAQVSSPSAAIDTELAPGNPVAHVLAASQQLPEVAARSVPDAVQSGARIPCIVQPPRLEPKKFL